MIRTAVKFGFFTLVCIAATTYLAFTIGNISINDPLTRDYYTLQADFSDVTGLLPSDNVKVAGVPVGKVTGIKIVDGVARVTFKVENGRSLPADSTAQIRWRNLIGQRYLYIYPGDDTTTKLVDGNRIDLDHTEPVIDLGKLFNELGPIVSSIDPQNVNKFLDTVSQALDGNEDKIGQALDDLTALAKSLAGRDAEIGRLVENLNTVAGTITDRDQQIRVMLDNFVLLTTTLSANTGTLDTALQEFGRFSHNLNTLVDNNTSQIDQLIGNLATLVRETVNPNLPSLDRSLAGLNTAAHKIFRAGSWGEWLNQSILCLAALPPGTLGGTCPGAGEIPALEKLVDDLLGRAPTTTADAAAAPAAPTAPAPPTVIGSDAPSLQSGVDALVNLVQGALGQLGGGQ